MSLGKKIFLWAILPVLIVLTVLEAVWAELYRLATDSKFLMILRENYVKLKKTYTEDIWD